MRVAGRSWPAPSFVGRILEPLRLLRARQFAKSRPTEHPERRSFPQLSTCYGPAPMSATSFPKNKIKVLLLENIHETARKLIRTDGLDLEVLPGALGEAELAEKIQDVHLLGIRSKTNVTEKVLENAHRLL